MLEITVTTRHGVAERGGAPTQFGPDGGTIGRANTNRLVLDDPERTVSRVHAQVVYRNGLYAIIDQGSNPLQLNGRPLGAGNEGPLALGDRLTIGGFELKVSRLEPEGADTGEASAPGTAQAGSWPASSADDPFADLLEGLVPNTPGPAAPAPASAEDGPFPDPMGMSSAAPPDPFADLLGPDSSDPPSRAGERAPEDFSDLISPARGAKTDSIDALFGLGTPSGSDPLALTPLADPWQQPNTASASDPLAAFSHEAPMQPAARSDHLPVEHFGFVPPQASPPPVAMPPSVPAPSSPEPEAFDPFAGLDGSSTKALSATASAPPPSIAPSPAPSPAREQGQASHASEPASEEELLAAFLRGIGPLQQAPEQLTPGMMERIGEMMRIATEGTLQLLLTRQEFKREVRAQATMIAAQANNPLKFSPTVEVALAHLLGPGMRGFMPAQAAMRDAYQDLRAHEFGVMVGMRAALAHVIERFEPSELEKNITAKSRLDAIFSANRKAKLWDQFVALYGGIAKEAEDDFHNLFGKAFLKAYEEQMERLKDGK